jgi:aspartyl protease family protein
MTNDLQLGGIYILMATMLVFGALMARREPLARLVTISLAWVAIFAGGFVLFTFRDDLGWVAQRLRAEATGDPVEAGETIRIPMAIDGHFWVEGRINGQPVKFLVDSGATMTTIGSQTAARTKVAVSPGRNQMVRTGNGIVRVSTGYADRLTIGSIERDGMRMHIAQGEDLNVLGMNFLSSLERWGVEGRWLVLQP